MSTLRKLVRLSSADRRLVLEAAVWLVIARVMIAIMPFKRIAHHLGLRALGAPVDLADGTPPPHVDRVGWAVRAVAGRVGRIGSCLTQAIAGSLLLRRRGIESAICLGVAKEDREGIAAHAWLVAHDAILTGRSGAQRFEPISAFISGPQRVSVRSAAELQSPGQSAARALFLQSELMRVLDAFDAAGIESVVFKGVPLALTVYGEIGGRRFSDNDVLVRRRDVECAYEVARSLGYEPHRPLKVALRHTNEVKLHRSSPLGAGALDIHWSPFNTTLFPVREEYVWSRTEVFDRGLRCRIFEPHLNLVHLAYHYAAHGFRWQKALIDVARVWNAEHRRIEVGELLDVAEATGQHAALSIAFARAKAAGLLEVQPPEVRSRRAAVVLRLLNSRIAVTAQGRMVFYSLARPDRVLRELGRCAYPPADEWPRLYGSDPTAGRRLARPIELAMGSLASTLATPPRHVVRQPSPTIEPSNTERN